MHTSPNGRRLIEQFEGFREHAYRDQVGMITVGFGSTSGSGSYAKVTGHQLTMTSVVTREQADQILSLDLLVFEPDVRVGMGRFVPTQGQFDACVSLAFNLGGPRFRASRVAERLRAGDAHGAAAAFMLYVRAGGRFNQGLANRRHAEMLEFDQAGVHAPLMMALYDDMGCERAVPDEPGV